MATIEIDFENDAVAWWDAALDCVTEDTHPTFTKCYRQLMKYDKVSVDSQTLDAFLAVATKLEGWASDDYPSYAPHPVRVVR